MHVCSCTFARILVGSGVSGPTLVRPSVWELYEAFVTLLTFHCKWSSIQKAWKGGGLEGGSMVETMNKDMKGLRKGTGKGYSTQSPEM